MSTTNTITSLDHLLSSSRHEISAQPAKSKPIESVKTLESFHNQHMTKIRTEKTHLKDLKQELEKKRVELEALEELFMNPIVSHTASDI